MKIDLKELEALARAATPGPWSTYDATACNGDFSHVEIAGADGTVIVSEDAGPANHDSYFIAAANPAAVLELIALASAPVAPPVTPKHIEEIKDILLWPVTEDDARVARDMLQSVHFDLSMQLAAPQQHAQAAQPKHKLYRFDVLDQPGTVLAEGIGAHAESMQAAEEKARTMLEPGERSIRFKSNAPCHPARKCAICSVRPDLTGDTALVNDGSEPDWAVYAAAEAQDGADSRVTGNAQAALSDDRVFSIADAHADESREDGMRLLDRGGLLAFAADILATRQPAPVAAAVQGDAVRAALQMLYDDRDVVDVITTKQAAQVAHALAAQPPADAAPTWDADATNRLRSIVELLGLQSCVPDDLTGCEFAVLGFVRREIERLLAASQPDSERDAALKAINEIRNSIIGLRALNWSEHVYPLVAALDKAGYEGIGYPEARKYFGSLLERAVKAEDALAAMAAQQGEKGGSA